ncbi:MAG: tRNA epoxyqueuosine(34) reductase QueG [Parachlamydiaceae bacterium]|nr:tRNA epoxyqueuosine(34) reductase QueG [Parachlamydiaceae bacterium]
MISPISNEEVREQALLLGWDDVGITSAQIPSADIQSYLQWIEQDQHGKMAYMENQIRCYPEQLFPGSKSAIIFVTNYKQPTLPFPEEGGLVASYARGRDYHNIHRKRLKKFIHWLETRTGKKEIAKGFSDSTPILEKALAVQAGLGWFGKNTLLIHRRFGTFILLSGILTSLEFQQKNEFTRLPRCGSCTRCLDACPTQAFISPYNLDATKCLSYHLIESKQEIPENIQIKNPGYAFGCDICQDACPHNVSKNNSENHDFSPDSGIGAYLTLESVDILQNSPESLFGTPLQRRGVPGLKHSLEKIKENS